MAAKSEVFGVGPGSGVIVRGERVHWIFDSGGGFRPMWDSVPLPVGVDGADVAAVGAQAPGLVLLARGGDFYLYDLRRGEWSRSGNIFEPQAAGAVS